MSGKAYTRALPCHQVIQAGLYYILLAESYEIVLPNLETVHILPTESISYDATSQQIDEVVHDDRSRNIFEEFETLMTCSDGDTPLQNELTHGTVSGLDRNYNHIRQLT
jgi:hypothetical protein